MFSVKMFFEGDLCLILVIRERLKGVCFSCWMKGICGGVVFRLYVVWRLVIFCDGIFCWIVIVVLWLV